MIRPPSIVKFEYCYLGAWALGLINTAINWSRYQQMAQVQQANAAVGSWYLPTIIGVGILIPLILWYFVARRASVIAKWIVVVFAALAVSGAVFTLLVASFATGIGAMLALGGYALQVAAAWLLFRPDAKAWFGERDGDVGEDLAGDEPA
ncbi:MAG TPA: hypothetical protein VM900_00775 [Sphingomonas sp.]|nr:hypothetical protein [Sphingomonas sp.]